MVGRYGWRRDRPDARDYKFSRVMAVRQALPPVATTQAVEPPIWDQGDLGSCTGHGVCRAMMMARKKAGLPDLMLSRLMVYYNARQIDGTIDFDVGAQIRSAIKGAASAGVAPEVEWPYDIVRFDKPAPSDVWTDALADCVKGYSRLDNSDIYQLKSCIAGGDPFVFGFDVPERFESPSMAATGQMAWDPLDQPIGAHCVVATGYDDSKDAFFVANSWGENWGIGGRFWMDYRFMTSSQVSDCWHTTAVGYGPSTQP